jgi:dTDP-4-dehydrorhamnose 3,5-epimerase
VAEITPMGARPTRIDGLVVLDVKAATDERGTVRELYRRSAHGSIGAGPLGPWAQVNVTETRQGAVRGLHGEDMTKLVAVVHGEALGAYVDLRPGSATFAEVETVVLAPGTQVLVPAGVANGFQATAPGVTQYVYCFDREWEPGMAGASCTPLDPELGISWPLPIEPDDPAQISAKDRDAPTVAQVLEELR